MTKEREALRLALKNLLQATRHLNACPATVEAAEKVLAQPEQMPVLQILATAIAKAATLAGITDCSKHSFTGPQLLMLLNDLKELAIKAPPQPEQDVDYWIKQHTEARQAELELRRELEALKAEQERELAFAGVKVWVGNQLVLRGATREDLHHADDPWTILRLHSEVCIATLKERNQ